MIYGRVRSLDRYVKSPLKNQDHILIKSKILKESKNKKGYYYLNLCKLGTIKMFRVHRLVAETFIPNPENKLQVNHINGNKTDNRVENLEWCTASENIQHAWKTGLSRTRENLKEFNKEKFSKKILQYDLNNNFIKEWESIAEIERQLKINDGNICSCCLGLRKTAGGFIWKHKDTQ